MAQIEKKPVLSLCIPIYNRIAYLERQLTRFLEDKQLFEEQVQLIVSDNCSTDDLQTCCMNYQQKGLQLIYHRQDSNLGPDGNFDWCFHHADGKYVWLLGSDDVPVSGLLAKVVCCLESSDYGLVHLSMRKQDKELILFERPDDIVVAVNYWITFMSANIIQTNSLQTVNLSNYKKSFLIQVPAYLNACFFKYKNAILYQDAFFEKGADFVNNGGYDIFQVFVANLYGIYESFINKGLLSVEAFNRLIKIEYREFLLYYVIRFALFHKKSNFNNKGSWSLLLKYYKYKPYFYVGIITGTVKTVKDQVLFRINKRKVIN